MLAVFKHLAVALLHKIMFLLVLSGLLQRQLVPHLVEDLAVLLEFLLEVKRLFLSFFELRLNCVQPLAKDCVYILIINTVNNIKR